MRVRQRTELRRLKHLPPLLELDDEGVPIIDFERHEGRRWSSDADEPVVRLGEFPAED